MKGKTQPSWYTGEHYQYQEDEAGINVSGTPYHRLTAEAEDSAGSEGKA